VQAGLGDGTARVQDISGPTTGTAPAPPRDGGETIYSTLAQRASVGSTEAPSYHAPGSAILYACHPGLVNGYPRRTDDLPGLCAVPDLEPGCERDAPTGMSDVSLT